MREGTMGDDEGECKRSDESRKKDEGWEKRCKGGREEGVREWEKEGVVQWCSGRGGERIEEEKRKKVKKEVQKQRKAEQNQPVDQPRFSDVQMRHIPSLSHTLMLADGTPHSYSLKSLFMLTTVR